MDNNSYSQNQNQEPSSRQPPPKQKSQQDQDKDDEKARKKARDDLVQSQMDRLQLISVITTFFAANEAQLLSITTPSGSPSSTPPGNQAANALLSGALVFHSFSAVIAFIGAFVLVRYKLKEAKKEEAKEEGKDPHEKTASNGNATDYKPFSTNPHIERVGGFMNKRPPNELLSRTHSIAISTAFIGFVFGIVGIICFAWTQQTQAVGIFSSACIGACIVVTIFLLAPLGRAAEETS